MSQSKATRDRIRTFVQRIERIEEEVACLNADKSEVYKEAKGEGYDLAALRMVVSERRKRAKNPDLYRETRSLFDIYMDAVEGSSGTDRATRVHDLPPPTQAMGITPDPDPSVTIINETPAPITSPADGGLPHPSVPAEPPQTAASTSGSGPEEPTSASEGTQPAEPHTQGVAQPGSAPGLEPGGRRFESSRPDQTDDGLDIPAFMKRDKHNRAPWMDRV